MQAFYIALLSVAGLMALLFCFAGSRYFRAVFTLAAFFIGLIVVYCLAGIFFTTIFAKIAIVLAGGLVFALIFNQLQFLGRFVTGVLGCLSAGLLAAVAFNISNSPYFWDAVMAVCLVIGLLCAVGQPLMLRISTAVFGAFVFSLSVFYIIMRGAPDADFQTLQAFQQAVFTVLKQYLYPIAGATAFFSLAGAFVQFFAALRQAPEDGGYRPAYTAAVTPPLLADPEAKPGTLPGRYTGRHVKFD